MAERRILFVRHGETDWNSQLRFQGSIDIPLNRTGEDQAFRLSVRLRNWNPDRCFSSPQIRALKTAKIVTESLDRVCQPEPLEDLREISFGVWEGQPIGDIMKNYGDDYLRWREDPSAWCPPEAEEFQSVQARVGDAIGFILDQPGDRFLVVAHGGTIRAAISSLFGLPAASVWKIRLGNCALTGVSFWEGRPNLHFINDCVHSNVPKDILSSLSVDL